MIDTHMSPARPHDSVPAIERLWLVPIQESDYVQPRLLAEESIDIGSSSTCDISLPVPGVEAHHCTIRLNNGRAVLTAHSRLTWINEGPVRETVLQPGQRLAIGPIEFRLEKRIEHHGPGTFEPADHFHQTVRREAGLSPADLTDLLTWLSQNSASTAAPTGASRDFGDEPARRPASPDTEAADRDSERRRRQVEQLRSSVPLPEAADLQRQLDNQTAPAESHHKLHRLRKSVAIEQAALREDRAAWAQLYAELEWRVSELQHAQERLSSRKSDLRQTSEQLEEERRQQCERESLLRARIEEMVREEAALAERQAEWRARQPTVEQDQPHSSTSHDSQTERNAGGPGETQQRLEELERSSRRLDEQVRQKDRELERLASTHAEQQSQLVNREQSLCQREHEIDRRSNKIAEREAATEAKWADLESRERSLTQREDELDQRSADIARARQEQAATAASAVTQSGELDVRLRELEVARGQLQADREQLAREQDRLRRESDRIETQRNQLDIDRQQLADQQAALDSERQRADQERAKLDDDRKHVADLERQWEARQHEIHVQESRVAKQLSDLEQRQQDFAAREASLRQREEEIEAAHEQDRSADDEAEQSQREAEIERARQELDELRESLLQERGALEAHRAALQEAEQNLDSDRAKFDAAQEVSERERAALEATRDALSQERQRLNALKDEISREQATLRRDDPVASDQRATAQAIPSTTASKTISASGSIDSTHSEDYEIADSAADALTTEADSEIVDDPDVDDTPAEHVAGLRSQLADLFSIPPGKEGHQRSENESPLGASPCDVEHTPASVPTEIPQPHSAQRPSVDSPTSPADGAVAQSVTHGQGAVPSAESAAAPAESDSIAAYMDNLMARIRSGSPGSPSVAAVAGPPRNRPESSAAPPSVPETRKESASRAQDAAGADSPKVRIRPDATLERAHRDTFRELANRSARTAVAKHNSVSLRRTFLVKAILTAVLLGITILLMTSRFWVGVSYASWVFAAAAAVCVSAFELLKSKSRIDAESVYERPESNSSS